jgi:hypothetical protein
MSLYFTDKMLAVFLEENSVLFAGAEDLEVLHFVVLLVVLLGVNLTSVVEDILVDLLLLLLW